MRQCILFFFFLFLLLPTHLLAQPENDNCTNAIALNSINGGCYFNANLINATKSLPAENCNSALVQDIWFSFIADSTFHRVSVNPSSGMDAVLEVRSGDSCNGDFLACIDQGGGDGAVENLALNNLVKGNTYFIRIYDFTGSGIKPSTWQLDVCVSGFEPTEVPDIQLINPKGGETFEAGSILTVQAEVKGVISGKEVAFSKDNGASWEIIWQSSSPNPFFEFDWFVPSINAEKCLIKTTIFQLGEAYEAINEQPFRITTNPNPQFQLSQELSHLYWPFYNPSIIEPNDFHIPSEWQNQEDGVLITSDDVVNTWFFFNDHYWQNSGRWHHSGDNCFAQDWNFINGGNSDCRMYFFSPMAGKVLFQKDACLNFNCGNPTCTSGCGNYIVVQSIDDPSFAYRACHFSELNDDIVVGDVINAGDLIARVGNEGSSSAAHVHFVLYKNLSEADIATLAVGATLSSNSDPSINPANLSDLCFDKAANFRFDVRLDNPITHIPPVDFQPVLELKLFPNPNNGQFNLSLNANANQFMIIEVFDSMGQRVFFTKKTTYLKDSNVKVELGNAVAGMYVIRIRFDQELIQKRIIITN